MSNSKKIASIAFTGAAVTATTTFMAIGPAATPAAAAGCIVRNNGVCVGTDLLKAKNKAGTTTVLVDTTKNTTLTCKKAFTSGHIFNGSGSRIGVVSKASWTNCSGPFGLTFNAVLTAKTRVYASTVSVGRATGGLCWSVSGGHCTSGSSRVRISGKISGTGLGAGCHARISGISIPWKYVNATHSFIFNSRHKVTLQVKSAGAGCLGTIAAGDKAYFAGTYHVSSPNALTIS